MKIVSTITLLLLLTFSLNAQVEVETKYVNMYNECETHYENLQRQVNQGPNEADYYLLNDEPFTGCAKADHPENDQYFMYHMRDGVVQQMVGYFYNGKLAREFNYSNGLSDGKHVMFNADGSPYIEEMYDMGKPVYLKRWHPNGRLAREAEFENGEALFDKRYDKDGTLIVND